MEGCIIAGHGPDDSEETEKNGNSIWPVGTILDGPDNRVGVEGTSILVEANRNQNHDKCQADHVEC